MLNLKLDIPSLQTETIELLEKINFLLHQFSDDTASKYKEYQQQLENQINSVRKLELRMAIVAQMNAGKSTIINAIIGQDILPTHDAAMTTLPTELVFKAELREPVLKLSDDTCLKFQNTIETLQDKIREQGIEWAIETANSSYLNEQIKKIQKGFSISTQTEGHEQIRQTLTTLNHIVRLCSKLAPEDELLESLTDVPRIETPFWRSQQTEQLQAQGKLVIVDTPGQNEAGATKLREVVSAQLQQSSLVLIVLDYTQLTGEATAEVKQEVQKAIALRGTENLYVLVNKIDQRGSNPMSPEQVQQFVSNELGVEGTDRVFEISAEKAFCATNFMLELQDNPNVALPHMKTAKALAKQTLGIDWEEEVQTISTEKLKSTAEKLWDKSGFAPFLKQAINVLMAQGTHRCMRTALNTSSSCLVQLSADLSNKRSLPARSAVTH